MSGFDTVGAENSTTRDQWVQNTLLNLPAGLTLLDAGAGEQKYRTFCQHLNYISQDFAQYDGKGDDVGLQMGSWDVQGLDIISDITAIPLPNASVDVILCTEVFEHLSRPILALQEFNRLLRPQGHLIMSAPFCSLTHFAPYHYYSGYNRYFYLEFFPESSYEIIELQPNGNYFEFIAQELRRLPDITRQYAGETLDGFEQAAINTLLRSLAVSSESGQKSSEILCFGYHVHVVKR